MPKASIELLLKKAQELEKKYVWIDAKDAYEKVSKLALERKEHNKAAKLNERIGYCMFRAALQAETSEQFRTRMRLSSQAYEHAIEILQNVGGEEGRTYHASAMVAYTSSWFEPDLSRMETLLEEWWRLENKALVTYEEEQDPLAIGRTCNNLMEYSVDRWFFFDYRKYLKRGRELINIGEKAITALQKTIDKYEMARAYCWTAWYYAVTKLGTTLAEKAREKSQIYAEKALSLAEDIGDGWLIGWSYNTISSESIRTAQDFSSWLNQAIHVIEQGHIIKDNYMMATGKWKAGMIISRGIEFEEDPEEKRQELRRAVKWTGEAIAQSKLINAPIVVLLSQLFYCMNLISLASIETDIREKRALTEEAVKIAREGLEYSKDRNWVHVLFPKDALARALFWLSKTGKNNQEKRRYLEEGLKIREEARIAFAGIARVHWDTHAVPTPFIVERVFDSALMQSEMAKLEPDPSRKKALFNEAVLIWEKCFKLAERIAEATPETSMSRREGLYYYDFGDFLGRIYKITHEKLTITRAIEVYKKAIEFFCKFKLSIHSAGSYWKLARTYSLLGEPLEASKNYELAAEAYRETIERNPKLRNFCENHSTYMSAWSQIEKAKYYHTREEPHKSRKYYEKAAKLHEESDFWGYMAPNYWAWAVLEDAELLSRQEKPREAIQAFEQAEAKFYNAEEPIKKKIKEIELPEEKQETERLIKALNLRRGYCQARIILEEAKILDRKGEYSLSSKNYAKAADEIGEIVEQPESEAERKELRLISVLCHAWEKMAIAEETTSSEAYLEAAGLFEQAKDLCVTKKSSLWALGNSSFCKGLAAGIKYQSSVDLTEHARAKSLMKSAATSYFQAGFKSASEYTKATQRLFDAYLFMNQAEGEADQERRAQQYQLAENLLQLAAGSFMKAKQPEKTAQVQEILATVREEKALAASLNEVMHAPSIASSTSSFAAPTPTSEVSVGLERFEHANVQANLVASAKEVKVGESFCLTLEFVNAGKESALLIRVEGFVPQDFVVVKKPEIYRLEDNCLNMKGKQIAPLKLVEAKLVLQPSKKGVYQLKPRVHYLDELGQKRSLHLKSVEIKVEEVVLADRISTGTKELDSLLLGGIPEECAVVLTGSPSDERAYLIKNFLEAGTKEGQTSFYVATEAVGLEKLIEKPSFYLFLCNPKPKVEVPDRPNVYKLRDKNLTNLNIALLKAYRNVAQSSSKRIVVEVVSDVLVDYQVKTTRKWIAELITDLVSKGFTVLAVMNPSMHPPDQATGVIDLFDGEISLYQTEDPLECKKSIRIKKLRNQDYIKNPICLTT